jgi:hypothetical protein
MTPPPRLTYNLTYNTRFLTWISKTFPDQKTKRANLKLASKIKLGQDHPIINFLADLSHRVRTFAKHLYALKIVAKGQSEMNDIDYLQLN